MEELVLRLLPRLARESPQARRLGAGERAERRLHIAQDRIVEALEERRRARIVERRARCRVTRGTRLAQARVEPRERARVRSELRALTQQPRMEDVGVARGAELAQQPADLGLHRGRPGGIDPRLAAAQAGKCPAERDTYLVHVLGLVTEARPGVVREDRGHLLAQQTRQTRTGFVGERPERAVELRRCLRTRRFDALRNRLQRAWVAVLQLELELGEARDGAAA